MILQAFTEFSQSQMIFISFLLVTLVYASIQLRSVISMVSTTLTVITLVTVMQFGLSIIYFWYMVIITFIAISVSVTVFMQYN
jgi:hypothetical protein